MNIEKLCRSCIQVVASKAPSLQREATVVSNKFEQAFKLFAVCRADYDSDKVFTNSDVETLGKLFESSNYTVLYCTMVLYCTDNLS
ncbi:MAG: hypothetical protein DSY43_00525 [Gammaproteobacteria bacterium]|nr:MAG: hypothetical protein DSY43_00525 [Gammaproteobacteria bacterium]